MSSLFYLQKNVFYYHGSIEWLVDSILVVVLSGIYLPGHFTSQLCDITGNNIEHQLFNLQLQTQYSETNFTARLKKKKTLLTDNSYPHCTEDQQDCKSCGALLLNCLAFNSGNIYSSDRKTLSNQHKSKRGFVHPSARLKPEAGSCPPRHSRVTMKGLRREGQLRIHLGDSLPNALA